MVLAVVAGIGIAAVSFYRSSVSGLMTQVGLVGSDFNAAVATDKVDSVVSGIKGTLACDLPTRMKGAITFMLGGDEEQARLAFKLGDSRIKCGAVMLSQGKAEEGTYEIIKGIGYLKQGYSFVSDRVAVDRRVCSGVPGGDVDTTIVGVLDATSGRMYEIIWKDWQEVVEVRKPVAEACLDQRNSTR